MNLPPSIHCRLAIVVRGVVQGVGFRPFIYNAAVARGLAGWVQNQSGAVLIEVEGPRASLDEFLHVLRSGHPPQARVDAIEVRPIACRGEAATDAATPRKFKILPSDAAAAPQPACPPIWPFARCAWLKSTTRSSAAIATRSRTPPTAARMVESFAAPLRSTADVDGGVCDVSAMLGGIRRSGRSAELHAQPIACPQCGPRLELLDAGGRRLAERQEAMELSSGSFWTGECWRSRGWADFNWSSTRQTEPPSSCCACGNVAPRDPSP